MKKSWCLFLILSVVFAAGITVGGMFAARVSGVLSAVFVISGAAVWTGFFAHFRTVGYAVENGVLIIRGGFFLKAERRISVRDILWRTTVRIGSAVLFSVIHTAAGRAVLFTRAELFISSED